ncbi:hypothetical protein ASA1KI_09410 [Opitutales bacterium ASA1]|uniref:nucleoside-diphosphate sugar epimerase/dehydratase n=1 Tax=Congregicoccus parvus TaxID=3081749 RepID=UPI002B314675|nr:hypothetical protein ASA1KI_09410 [Opitutales bacterium ASA1]
MSRRKRAVIFGAGGAGRRTLDYYSHVYECVAFVDNDAVKLGTSIEGLTVYPVTTLAETGADVVLVGSGSMGEITMQLTEMGVSLDRIGWVPEDVLTGRFEGMRRLRRRVGSMLVLMLAVGLAFVVYWRVGG